MVILVGQRHDVEQCDLIFLHFDRPRSVQNEAVLSVLRLIFGYPLTLSQNATNLSRNPGEIIGADSLDHVGICRSGKQRFPEIECLVEQTSHF